MSSVRDKYNKGTNKVPKKKTAADSLLTQESPESQRSVNTGIQEAVNTGIQEVVNTGMKKTTKKATFEIDLDLHKELKRTAVVQDRSMVELVEEALKLYFEQMK